MCSTSLSFWGRLESDDEPEDSCCGNSVMLFSSSILVKRMEFRVTWRLSHHETALACRGQDRDMYTSPPSGRHVCLASLM